MEALVAWVTDLVRRQSWRRGLWVAVPLFTLAFAFRLWLDDIMQGRPFVLFVPVVLVTVLVGGGMVGFATALLSWFTGWYYFIEPYRVLALPTARDSLALLFAWVSMAITVLLVAALSRSIRALDTAQAATQSEAEARRMMFHELQHRVANNLQFVSALLGLASGQVNSAEDGRTALADAQRRLQQMARLHRWLHDPDAGRRDLCSLLGAICEQLRDATGEAEASFELSVAPVALPPESLTAVALIVNEAVTNALKHASGPLGPLLVQVDLQRQDEALELTVRDNGPGMPKDMPQDRAGGVPHGVPRLPRGSLGLRVMEALALQLGGRLELSSDNGAVVRVRFPAADKAVTT